MLYIKYLKNLTVKLGIYVSNGKFLNWVCLSILILGVFRTKQEN